MWLSLPMRLGLFSWTTYRHGFRPTVSRRRLASVQYQAAVLGVLGEYSEYKRGVKFNPRSAHTAMDTQVPFCALSRFWCSNSFTLTHQRRLSNEIQRIPSSNLRRLRTTWQHLRMVRATRRTPAYSYWRKISQPEWHLLPFMW